MGGWVGSKFFQDLSYSGFSDPLLKKLVSLMGLSLHLIGTLKPSTVKHLPATFGVPHPGVMAMNHIKSLRGIMITKETVRIVDQRTFATSTGKAKKGGKGGAAADAPKASSLSKEVKSSTVVGANILKDGADPKILPDSEYPDWLWHLLDKRPALSELKRKNIETLPFEDLKRFVKLDNRARIKENNSVKAKN